MVKDVNKFLQTIQDLLHHVSSEYGDELLLDKTLNDLHIEVKERFDDYTLYKNNLPVLLDSIERLIKYSFATGAKTIAFNDQTLAALISTLLEEFPHLKERL